MTVTVDSEFMTRAWTPLRPLLISVDQFRSLMQCGRTTAFEMIRTKRVRSVLIGRSRRILFEDAERLVADALREVQG